MGAEKGEETFLLQLLVVLLTSLGNFLLCLCEILGGKLALYANEFLHQRLVLLKHLVVAFGYRTGDDQRCTGIVNQHGVNLVDDSVVMGTLYKVLW